MPTVRRSRPFTRFERYYVEDDDGSAFYVYSIDPRDEREAILIIVHAVDEVPAVFQFGEPIFSECARPSKRAALIAVRAFRDGRRRPEARPCRALDRFIRGTRRTAWARVLALE